MHKLGAWMKALRMPSQSYIFFPILLGHAIYYAANGKLNWPLFAAMHLFGLFIQAFIVLANDVADEAVDRGNSTYNIFSGGSRVLPQALLTRAELRAGVWTTMALNVAAGAAMQFVYGRRLALVFVAVSLLLLWAYSYGPLRLSYRGGGEFLQMTGVGGVLPLFAYYVQADTAAGFPWRIYALLLPTQLACAMATGLPDYPSDRDGPKRTAAVLLGPDRVKALVVALNFVSLGLALLIGAPDLAAGPCRLLVGALALLNAGLLLVFSGAEPGSPRLNAFVTIAVAVTVLFTASLSAMLVWHVFLRA